MRDQNRKKSLKSYISQNKFEFFVILFSECLQLRNSISIFENIMKPERCHYILVISNGLDIGFESSKYFIKIEN